MLKLSKLEANKGQIEGLPKNPRIIKDDKFKKLVKSIEDNPEMTSLREILVYPHEGKYVVIGGNMRLKAMKELGYKEALKTVDSFVQNQYETEEKPYIKITRIEHKLNKKKWKSLKEKFKTFIENQK